MKNKLQVLGNIYCAGVYGMRCRDSKEYLYLGSSLEVNDAMARHLYFLKRNLYSDTNKAILQEKYDSEELIFEIIKESCHDKISEMSAKEKDDLSEALATLEEFYINLYKNTCCNVIKKVTRHSSNKNSVTRYKRKKANIGSRNPNSKYDEIIIQNILWLKMNGYKPKEIEEMYKDKVDIKSTYIYNIGVNKWIHIEPLIPEWLNENIKIELTSTPIDIAPASMNTCQSIRG